eukprot:6329254-Amphidinium_carterae.1
MHTTSAARRFLPKIFTSDGSYGSAASPYSKTFRFPSAISGVFAHQTMTSVCYVRYENEHVGNSCTRVIADLVEFQGGQLFALSAAVAAAKVPHY